jgi:DNA repair exonuclease SbcCD ATPase subunit
MITKIVLRGFQSHERTVLHLSSGINVIKGSSDSGKSSIVRGLSWVLFNRFRSFAPYKRHGTKETRVSVFLNDGDVITRVRNKAENLYKKDGASFEAVGSDVPDEIQKTLNISDIQVQTQTEPSFIFNQTSGGMARLINTMLNIEVIDKAVTYIRQKKDAHTKELHQLQIRSTEMKAEAESLQIYSEHRDDVLLYKEKMEAVEEEQKNMTEVLCVVKRVEERMEELQGWSSEHLDGVLRGLRMLFSQCKSVSSLKQETEHIEEVLQRIAILEEKKKDAQNLITEWDAFAESISNIRSEIRDCQCVEGVLLRVKELQSSTKQTENTLSHDIECLSKDIEKKMGKRCPLCGGRVTGGQI